MGGKIVIVFDHLRLFAPKGKTSHQYRTVPFQPNPPASFCFHRSKWAFWIVTSEQQQQQQQQEEQWNWICFNAKRVYTLYYMDYNLASHTWLVMSSASAHFAV